MAGLAAPPIDEELASLVLAIEDRRFSRHRGVDARSLLRAAWGVIRRRPSGGGSTIDMQLVRTLTGRYDRTVGRKLIEIVLAFRLRRRFGAEHILNAYAAVAYCGEDIAGIHAAAEHLFRHPVAACSRAEKAVLATVLLHPIPRVPGPGWQASVDYRAARALRLVAAGQPAAKFSDPAP